MTMRLRMPRASSVRPPQRNNRHIPCASGRPLRLAIRALAACLLSLFVLHLIPGQPATPALVTGLIVWFLRTGRSDLAPPW
jgi:hypothetical protein